MKKKKSKLRLAVSPLTNTIFVGRISKDGLWKEGKQDVTMDCLIAVAEHVKAFGESVQVTDADTGELLFKITVD